jgi:hypothetical protein
MSERFKDVSTEELGRRINAKQQFLEKVAVFVAAIAPKIGEVKRRGGSDSCSETDWEVIDFGHFSFKYNTGWSDVYEIYYHAKVESIRLGAMTPVLVFVEGAGREKKYDVRDFNEDPEWQTALLNVIERKDELLAQRKKAEEERQEQLRAQTEEERKRAKLIEEAERLKL